MKDILSSQLFFKGTKILWMEFKNYFFTFYSIQINVKKYSTIIMFSHLLPKVRVLFEIDLFSWDCD